MNHMIISIKVQLVQFGEVFFFVFCFFFIMHMLCVLSKFSRIQLYKPMDHSLPGSSVRVMLQARILWVAMPLSR